MSDLTASYMGIELKNPIIAGASELTSDMDKLKEIEDAGAGAVVIKSLFEEQVQLEKFRMDEEREESSYRYAEMISILPEQKHSGPQEHLYWVEKAKKSLSIPVIASLNAVEPETWIEYAGLLEETGADGLELNFYATPDSFERNAGAIENEQLSVLKKTAEKVSIPVSVKLSFFYTNPLHFISRVDRSAARGMILFNRLFQPDIDLSTQENIFPFNLSERSDNRLPLRFTGLLFGNVDTDVCSSTGIMEGEDVIKMILAGASAVQVVSTLYKNGAGHLSGMLKEMRSWMEKNGYGSLDDFRGRMSRKNSDDPWVYTRAQYVKLLLDPEELLGR